MGLSLAEEEKKKNEDKGRKSRRDVWQKMGFSKARGRGLRKGGSDKGGGGKKQLY